MNVVVFSGTTEGRSFSRALAALAQQEGGAGGHHQRAEQAGKEV